MGGLLLSVLVFSLYYISQLPSTSPTLPTRPDLSTYILMIIIILYAVALMLLCFKGIPRKKHRGRGQKNAQPNHYLSPILLGLSIGAFVLMVIVWPIQTFIVGEVLSFPDPSEYFTFGMYPCLMGAILLLPAPNLPLGRARVFLDSLLIMIAVATLTYYFFLGPLLIQGGGTLQGKVVGGVFVSLDLILMFCLLLVVLRAGDKRLYPVLILLGCAIFSLFLTHMAYTYAIFYKGEYRYFSLTSLGWPLVGIFLVSAAQTITNILKHGETPGQREHRESGRSEIILSDRRWRTALPAILVLVFTLLIVITWISGGIETFPEQRMIVYGGGLAVLILMVLRQLLTLYQVGALQRQLQVKNRSLSMLNTYLEEQATRDALTGLPNHRTVVEKLDEALTNARKTRGSCGVIFMDVDEFKSINDTYGHITGDTVLTNFSAVVKSGLRANDWVGRWGGEEFVAILPDTEPLETLNLAEGLRKRVDQHVLAGNGEVNVTCSLGVANYPQDAHDREELIAQADNAMYAAKRLGRNQTRSAHEPLVQTLENTESEHKAAAQVESQAMIEALLASLAARDPDTVQHMHRVSALALNLALALGVDNNEAHLVSVGGLLHDIGKLAIPDAILGKPGKLEEHERTSILQHPAIGATILQSIHSLQAAAPIVRAHHEQINGLGYPDGLRGDEIPLAARIVAVADVYDAMTSARPYQAAKSSSEALRILQKGAGTHFDPRVVETLTSLLTANSGLSSTI